MDELTPCVRCGSRVGQCKGCPHSYHPMGVCGADMPPPPAKKHGMLSQTFSSHCPCSYDIDEGEGNEQVGKEQQWPLYLKNRTL